MKRRIALILSIVMAFTLLSGCTSGNPAESSAPPTASNALSSGDGSTGEGKNLPAISLNYSSNFPETHRVSQLDLAWFQVLQDEANITVVPYWSNTLCSSSNPYMETASGLSDITHIAPGSEKDHFIIENAIQFFFYGTTNKQALYDATVELFETTPEWQAEYAGVKVLFLGSMGDLYLFTKEAINNVEAVKGASIRCTEDQSFQLVEKMGGTALRMAVSELYESLEKNIINGIINGTNSIEQYQLAELLPYGLNLRLTGSFCVHCYMNEDSWNKLTADQQEILLESAKDRALAQASALDGWDAASGEYCREAGMTFSYLSDEDQAKLDQFYEALALAKVEELNAAGYDGQAIFEHARELVEKYAAMYE